MAHHTKSIFMGIIKGRVFSDFSPFIVTGAKTVPKYIFRTPATDLIVFSVSYVRVETEPSKVIVETKKQSKQHSNNAVIILALLDEKTYHVFPQPEITIPSGMATVFYKG